METGYYVKCVGLTPIILKAGFVSVPPAVINPALS